ncbi:MAG: response regulator [Thaumarchaeota archaeon]|nr:response regulator [Nitrososphaerota archaeon]
MPDGRNGKRKILIVDDETDITNSLKVGLENKGFLVEAYNDPIEALARVKADGYDLAIFDIRMPTMTGFELYRQFRKIDDRVGICFMTAYDVYSAEFKTVFPDIQAASFFKKPISIEKLTEGINKVLGSARETAEKRKVPA